ncbi:type 4a pilus biogenesis protein PilO [Candidatus Gottesmanbacteria bacterium]|nr:type 4a pilus biogenesis protein PilO [Candidatus Gottesmanbacteria bacterium]
MMRIFRRILRLYQGFIVSGVILLFGTLGVIFAVVPGVQATIALYERLGVLEKEHEALSTKLSFLTSMQEDNLRDQLAMLLSVVPQDKSVPSIFTTLEGLAQQSGVSIGEINLTSPGSLATGSAVSQMTSGKKIGASTLPFLLSATGVYDQIRSFVSSINQVKRLFDVTSFEFSIGSAGVTRVSLSLSAFYQPLPTKVGSVEAPLSSLTPKEEDVLAKLIKYPDFSASAFQPLTPVSIGGKRDPFAR